MKIIKIATLLLGMSVSLNTLAKSNAKMLTNDRDKLSYSLGVMTGEAFRTHGIDINAQYFSDGFYDALNAKKIELTDQQIQAIIQNFQKKAKEEVQNKMKVATTQNLEKGIAFLENNKKKPGVITLKSGLQYKVIKAGHGQKPMATDVVVVDYEGRLIDGVVFDSSYKRGEPVSFPVNQVIQGWQEALSLMPVGSEWEVYVPSALAYGDTEVPNIGPNQVLIFKIHLLSIKNK